jgi:hypothetical protein
MSRHVGWIGALAAGLVLVSGAHCSTPSPAAGTGAPSPIVANTATMCMSVTPEGGSLIHPGGATMIVPPGALDRTTELCLSGIAPPASDGLGAVALGQGFEATPAGQTFRKPVEIVVPFDATRLPPGTDLHGVQLRLAPRGTSDFSALQSTIGLDAGTVHAKTVHFTQFVPAVTPNPVFITSPDSTLPAGTEGVGYSQTFGASGGTTPYVWRVSPSTSTPPGLLLDPGGTLAGTPTTAGDYAFFLVATDSANHSVQAAFSLTVSATVSPLPPVATDAGDPSDAGASDAGPSDAGANADADDTSSADAASTDASSTDASSSDASPTDASSADGSSADASSADAASADAGDTSDASAVYCPQGGSGVHGADADDRLPGRSGVGELPSVRTHHHDVVFDRGDRSRAGRADLCHRAPATREVLDRDRRR